jgi:UDP-glucose 4-epimerase
MTIIIGKNANLSIALAKALPDIRLISSQNPIKDLEKLELGKTDSVHVIFNNFQRSTMLYDVSDPTAYVQRALMCTAEVLEHLEKSGVALLKILYTSSSSVYGNNIFCKEDDPLIPTSLHASLKITNEKLVESFCQKNSYDYTICRVFNMYGGNDNFSIISKIIRAARENIELTLYNNGNAVRDFIHIDDVVTVYKALLETRNTPIVNVGTSNGISVRHILDFLRNHQTDIRYKTIDREELRISTADISRLQKILPDLKFGRAEEYILKQVGTGSRDA